MGIVKWTEYEDKFRECEEWLMKMDNKVQSYNRLQNKIQEKRLVLEEFQSLLQKIFDWQKTLDLLNMRAQLLLETCADSRVSNAVTQLTTKYNTLLSLAKEVMRRLEMHYQEHQQHHHLYTECNEWIERTRDKLKGCVGEANTLEELNVKLGAVKIIKNSLEQGQHKLRYVLELKERVIMNTEQQGSQTIQENTDNLRQDFERLMSDIYSAQQAISAKLSRCEETEKMCGTVKDWLDELNSKATDQGILFSELSEKRGGLEKYKILYRDIIAHSDMINRLDGKQEEEGYSQDDIDECVEKYNEIKELVGKNITLMDVFVKDHEAYHHSYMEATEWLRKIRLEVQSFSDVHGEKKTVLQRQNKQVEIANKFPEGDELCKMAISLNRSIRESTSTEGQDTLRSEADSLNSEWESLKKTSSGILKTMEKCIKAWDDFASTYQSIESWLTNFQEQIANEPNEPTPEDLQKWKVIYLNS